MAILFSGLSHDVRWSETPLDQSAPAVVIALASMALVLPFRALSSVAHGASYQALSTSSSFVSGWVYSIGSVAAVVACCAAIMFWLLIEFTKLRVVDVIVLGVAVLGATAASVFAHPVLGSLGLVGPLIVQWGLGLCDAVVMAVVISRIAGGLHWRLATPAIALWFGINWPLMYAVDKLSNAMAPEIVLPPVAFVAGLAGLVLVLAGIAARDQLTPVEEADSAPTSE